MQAFFLNTRWCGYWAWAHNLEYDIKALWGRNPPMKISMINGNVYFADIPLRKRERKNAKYSRGSKTQAKSHQVWEYIHLCDSTRHFQGSLAKLGMALDPDGTKKLRKLRVDKHPREMTPAELQLYCVQDCYVLGAAIQEFSEKYYELGGNFNRTVGSTGLDIFQRVYMVDPIIRMDEPDLLEINQGYYGGRCEVFYQGEIPAGDYTMADVNSMYPSVMRSIRVPHACRNSLWITTNPDRSILTAPGMSFAHVWVPPMRYPPLPSKRKIGNSVKLTFPCGFISGAWAHNELNYAVSCGVKIIRIDKTYWWDRVVSPFTGYVNDLYALRQKGGMWDVVAKCLLNCLYGKFAQCRPASTLIGYDEFLRLKLEDETMDDITPTRTLYDAQGIPQAVEIKPEGFRFPRHSNMIWGAYITAAARIYLHQLLTLHTGYYADTDSVLTASEIPLSRELGAISVKQTCKGGLLLAPKCYRLREARKPGSPEIFEEIKVKGVPNRAGWYQRIERDASGREIPSDIYYTCKDLQRMVQERDVRVAYDSPMRIQESYRKLDRLPGMVEQSPGIFRKDSELFDANPTAWYAHTKHLTFQSDKRVPRGENAWTDPIYLGTPTIS